MGVCAFVYICNKSETKPIFFGRTFDKVNDLCSNAFGSDSMVEFADPDFDMDECDEDEKDTAHVRDGTKYKIHRYRLDSKPHKKQLMKLGYTKDDLWCIHQTFQVFIVESKVTSNVQKLIGFLRDEGQLP
jgi:hypothetical protein